MDDACVLELFEYGIVVGVEYIVGRASVGHRVVFDHDFQKLRKLRGASVSVKVLRPHGEHGKIMFEAFPRSSPMKGMGHSNNLLFGPADPNIGLSVFPAGKSGLPDDLVGGDFIPLHHGGHVQREHRVDVVHHFLYGGQKVL
ncbi:hypothetical protein SDC9_171952 [bioreactor metagenome]|uniref:Uncharacterized protein n=1 Tax=bioreactor metagenome TaxID=1076179 RepID=A0A645GLE9_9ZZZZ